MSGLNANSKKLLDAIFGNASNAWLVQAHYNGERLSMEKKEGPAGSFALDDNKDLYYCISTVEAEGRTKPKWVWVLVIDDVGKEISLEDFKRECPLEPSFVVESSKGSFQVGFRIRGGESAESYRARREAMKAHPVWGPAHGIDAARIFRLPQGTHTKPSRNGWKPREVKWNDIDYTPEELDAFIPAGVTKAAGPPAVVEWTLGEEALAELVKLIPNPLGLSRDDWLGIAHGIAGAGGGFTIFDEFSSRWEGAYNADETWRVWDTLGDDHHAKGGRLRALAEGADPDGFAAWKQRWEVRSVFDDGVVEEEGVGDDEINPIDGARFSTALFLSFLPTGKYIYLSTGELWVKETINSILPRVVVGVNADGSPKTITPSKWLDQNMSVTQMSWMPGAPRYISKKVYTLDGLRDDASAAIFNQYQRPEIEAGDKDMAEPWLDHVRYLYPTDAEALFDFFAHAVQRPWEKVNHGVLLGGSPGIGKDTMLHPVLKAVGFENSRSISPMLLRESFNAYLKSVVLVIDEIRDLGDTNQWAFYEQTKTLLAAPPKSLLVNEKFKPAYPIPNVAHVIMTTNSKFDGLYLPVDDRRHYVAWSDVPGAGEPGCADAGVFQDLWDWMDKYGGTGHVAAFLRARDLSKYNPQAAPARTKTFLAIVRANGSAEESDLADALDLLGRPGALTRDWLIKAGSNELGNWLLDKKNMRQMPKRLEKEGYEMFDNPDDKTGRWWIGGRNQTIYVTRGSTFKAGKELVKGLVEAERSAMAAIAKAKGGPSGPASDAFKE